MREEAGGSFESNVQSTWLVCLWEMYSRAPQIYQKTVLFLPATPGGELAEMAKKVLDEEAL